jgi:hypothetical protein
VLYRLIAHTNSLLLQFQSHNRYIVSISASVGVAVAMILP